MHPFVKKSLGVLCIVLGILFGILPLVPGVLLIIVGLELLGLRLLFSDRLKETFRRKKKEEKEEVGE